MQTVIYDFCDVVVNAGRCQAQTGVGKLVSRLCQVKKSMAQACLLEGRKKKSNKLVHAGEQEKGTRDTTGVKFY